MSYNDNLIIYAFFSQLYCFSSKISVFGKFEGFKCVEVLKIWKLEVRGKEIWSLNLTSNILWAFIKNRKFYCSGVKILMCYRALCGEPLRATDIKTTSMSIVGRVFCEFSRRRVLVVRSRDWYGGKWVSSLWPILSRSSRGTPCFVSTLKYESPGVPSCTAEKSEYANATPRNQYSPRCG